MKIRFSILFLVFIVLILSSYKKTVFPEGDGIVVKAIYVDGNNNKWFGTDNGLYFYNGTNWIRYCTEDYIINDSINALSFELSSYGPEIWVSTQKGVSVVSYDIDGITGATSYSTVNGVLGVNIADVVVDSRNNKIFGSDEGITFFSEGTMQSISYNDFKQSMINAPVNDLTITNDSIFIAFNGGIGRLVSSDVDGITGASRWTSEYGITPLSGNIICSEIDTKGNQWFGTDKGAERHIGLKAKENWTLFTSEDGLVNNYVNVIREASDNSIWFGTQGGVSKLSGGNWDNFTTFNGLVSDTVYDIAFEGDTVWFATDKGISILIDGQISKLDIISGIKTQNTQTVPIKIFQDFEKDVVFEFDDFKSNYVDVFVYDVKGHLVRSQTNYKLTGSRVKIKLQANYKPGIYFIKIKIEKELTYSTKIFLI